MLLFLLLALQSGAQAPPEPAPSYMLAKDLLARCSQAESWDYCYGYIASVYDTARAYGAWLKIQDMCVPRGTSQGELVATVVRHLRANPQDADSQAASVVVVALQRRYLCPGTAAPEVR